MCIREKLCIQAGKLALLRGCRRNFCAAVFGVCATATLPPVYLPVFLFPAFTGLLLLLQSAATKKRAFWDGWWFGLGFFVTGIYWVTISLFMDLAQFGWLIPFALFGLPGGLAIFIGLTTLCFRLLPLKGFSAWLGFAVLWTVFELLRGHIFTGFPWNLMGYASTFSTAAMQGAYYVGAYGLSFVLVLLGAAPALLVLYKDKPKQADVVFLAVCVATACLWAWGEWRLTTNPTQLSDTRIRLVQASIPQNLKWRAEDKLSNLRTQINLSQLPASPPLDIVIWPETATPYFIKPESALLEVLARAAPENGILITGALREEAVGENWKAWNSVFTIDSFGKIISSYDKNKLVPFGEYVPFRQILQIDKITQAAPGDFAPGNGDHAMPLGGHAKAWVLICYEAVFPHLANRAKQSGADWILNVTNDAWFGVSSGPYQHLEMTRMRAVEQGLPLVRSAHSGISAVFDGMGRELIRIPINEVGVADTFLPLPVSHR